MHTRQKIRDAVFELLTAHPDLNELFNARTKPTGEDSLPYANVITGTETAEDLEEQWREVRTVQVSVALYVRQTRDVANALDTLAEKVETLLGSDQTLGGVCDSFRYKGCQPDYESAAAQEAAMLTLNYECKYVWEPVMDADLLDTVQVSIDMAGPRNDPQLPSQPDGQLDAAATINLT